MSKHSVAFSGPFSPEVLEKAKTLCVSGRPSEKADVFLTCTPMEARRAVAMIQGERGVAEGTEIDITELPASVTLQAPLLQSNEQLDQSELWKAWMCIAVSRGRRVTDISVPPVVEVLLHKTFPSPMCLSTTRISSRWGIAGYLFGDVPIRVHPRLTNIVLACLEDENPFVIHVEPPRLGWAEYLSGQARNALKHCEEPPAKEVSSNARQDNDCVRFESYGGAVLMERKHAESVARKLGCSVDELAYEPKAIAPDSAIRDEFTKLPLLFVLSKKSAQPEPAVPAHSFAEMALDYPQYHLLFQDTLHEECATTRMIPRYDLDRRETYAVLEKCYGQTFPIVAKDELLLPTIDLELFLSPKWGDEVAYRELLQKERQAFEAFVCNCCSRVSRGLDADCIFDCHKEMGRVPDRIVTGPDLIEMVEHISLFGSSFREADPEEYRTSRIYGYLGDIKCICAECTVPMTAYVALEPEMCGCIACDEASPTCFPPDKASKQGAIAPRNRFLKRVGMWLRTSGRPLQVIHVS